jgi:hypothetical protein
MRVARRAVTILTRGTGTSSCIAQARIPPPPAREYNQRIPPMRARSAPMLDVLEWVKKRVEDKDGPPNEAPAPAGAPALSGLREADPATALGELGVQLEGTGGGAALADIQDTGAAHVAALLMQHFVNAEVTHAAREAVWKSLVAYQLRLAQALCAAAGAAPGAEASVRALAACRVLAKLHLLHYAAVPGRLWRVAYALHAAAEKAGFAAAPAHAAGDPRGLTTVEQEFLRLAMLCVSAPDMLAPEQIELADRIVAELGAEFTLRAPGVADNPFCFEPAGESGPRRAKGREPAPTSRFFGPGMGYASLERIARQAAGAKLDEFRPFGKDIAGRVQQATVQHLLAFWREDCPYAPPAHQPASGRLQVVHGLGAVWQQLSQARVGAGELSLADASADAPQAPETWELGGSGGGELSAEVPQQSRSWTKCGSLVGVEARPGQPCVGMIRRMRARPDGGMQAGIALLSLAPREVSLRAVLREYEYSVYTDASLREFEGHTLRAVILADGSTGVQANLLVAPGDWQEGRVYELQTNDTVRRLRGLQVVRRGDDYVRATFEWVAGAE